MSQQSKTTCSWEEGEAKRAHTLSNVSQWRQLHESEFQQYIASSNSSDSGSDKASASGSDGDESTRRSKKKRKEKYIIAPLNTTSHQNLTPNINNEPFARDRAARMRQMLLGNAEADPDSAVEDDFFAAQHDDDDSAEGAEGMELTYVPEVADKMAAKLREKDEAEVGHYSRNRSCTTAAADAHPCNGFHRPRTRPCCANWLRRSNNASAKRSVWQKRLPRARKS